LLRRLLPTLLALVCFLIDTTVLPMIYQGPYAVPLTVVLILCIGMILGRMRGLLYGTLTGLLVDITTGTLGMMTFFYMAVGFMIGLIVYEPAPRVVSSRRKQRRRILWQMAWVFALYSAGELALFVIQYFNTAAFQPVYLLNIVIRGVICTVLTMLFKPLLAQILVGRSPVQAAPRIREVKNF